MDTCIIEQITDEYESELDTLRGKLADNQRRVTRMAFDGVDRQGELEQRIVDLESALKAYATKDNWLFEAEVGWIWNGPSSLGARPFELAAGTLVRR